MTKDENFCQEKIIKFQDYFGINITQIAQGDVPEAAGLHTGTEYLLFNRKPPCNCLWYSFDLKILDFEKNERSIQYLNNKNQVDLLS